MSVGNASKKQQETGLSLVHTRSATTSQEREAEALIVDSIPSYEFHKIFRRVSYDVDLKGAFDPIEIDRRMEEAQKRFKAHAREAETETEKKRLYKKAKGLEILRDKGFPVQTIAEASENRHGIVNLTLQFGRKKAEEMKLAFERARIRQSGIQKRRRAR